MSTSPERGATEVDRAAPIEPSSHLDIKSTRDACGGCMVLSADGRTLWTASLLHGHAPLGNGELQSVSYLDLLERM